MDCPALPACYPEGKLKHTGGIYCKHRKLRVSSEVQVGWKRRGEGASNGGRCRQDEKPSWSHHEHRHTDREGGSVDACADPRDGDGGAEGTPPSAALAARSRDHSQCKEEHTAISSHRSKPSQKTPSVLLENRSSIFGKPVPTACLKAVVCFRNASTSFAWHQLRAGSTTRGRRDL